MSGLTLIYHFQSPQNTEGDFRPACYNVVYFFSDDGLIEDETLKELAKSVPEAGHHGLTFLSLDDLKVFAERVCQEVEAKEVKLLSVLDYNIGVDGAKDLGSYREIFKKFGETLQSSIQSKKKGLFGKFFN